MPLVSETIPNLINGVSQQPTPLRLPSQCEEQINAYSSVVEGLKKRPPLEYVAKLNNLQVGNAFVHTINRDSTERYVVIITNGDLKVYDLTGTQKTVNFPNGTSYLTHANPGSGFRALTVADYTFVVNLGKTVAFTNNKSPKYGSAGILSVRQASASSDYKVFVDGVQKANYNSGTANILTNYIAGQLLTQLTTNLGAGWTITRVGSTIEIKKNDGTAFSLDTEDSASGNLLKSAKEKVQRFTDLPVVAPRDFIVEVVGEPSSNFDNYFVKFQPSDASNNFGVGVWIETVKADITWELDPATMPFALIRQADGSFNFQQLTWGKRVVGDANSAPDPSFVGAMINDIFFFKNRLGLLSDENVIFSRAAKYFDFFPETVTTILDSDPIDVAASSTKVSILRHAVPFDEDLLLFSDQTQFVLKGGDILSSKTVSITQKTVFENSRTCKPVGAGKNVFFTVNKGKFSQIREYFVSAQNETNDAADITSHVPKYIPKDVVKLAVATNEDLLCVLSPDTPDTPNTLFNYKYYWRGDEKLQSAWSQWNFGSNCSILNIDFIDSVLYLVSQRSDGVYLEKLNVAPKQVDTNSTYLSHLDRRVQNNSAGVSVSYNAGTDETTWTLPYAISGTMQVVTRDSTIGMKEGTLIPVILQTGNTVKVKGKYDTEDVFIGQQYAMRYSFSAQFLREQTQNNGQSPVVAGRLQMRTWTVVFEKTGFFIVEVTPKYRDTYRYKFTGNVLGSGNNIIGAIPLEDGQFNFLVQSRNDQVKIELINDTFLPCHFLSAEWEAFYTSRSQRV